MNKLKKEKEKVKTLYQIENLKQDLLVEEEKLREK